MDQQAYIEFLGNWNLIMWLLSGISLVVAVIIFIAYQAKFGSVKDLKQKFDLRF